MSKPSFIDAESIWREAQKELKIAGDYYSKVYDIRRQHERLRWPIPENLKARIAEYSKESSKHRRKHKALMAKIVWDSQAGVYRMRNAKTGRKRK